MTQATALVWMTLLVGFWATVQLRRLAPILSELPAKAWLTAAAAAAVLLASPVGVPAAAAAIALPAVLWIVVPLLLPSLARAGGWSWAARTVDLLYWTPAARAGLRRLLTQTALQQGDGRHALALLPAHESEALAAQAHALVGDWEGVLALRLPAPALAPMAWVARIEALLVRGESAEAQAIAAELRRELERHQAQPGLYRALVLAEAHLDAAAGNVRRLQQMLESPPVGVAVDVWYGLLARAAERAGEREPALRLLAEGYRVARPARREAFGALLDAAGRERPAPLQAAGRAPATGALVGIIALAYLGQVWLDRAVGSLTLSGFPVDASSIAAALVLGIPDFPASGAPWRLLSYAFVHGNLLHVGFNLWVLFDLGRAVEVRRNPGYLLAAFALGTLAGGYLTATMQAGQALLLVGASGGVLGLAGAWLADLSQRRNASDRANLRSLVQWLVLMAFISWALPFVSWWGHLGGLLGGALWGFARLGLPRSRTIDLAAGVVAAFALAWAAGQALRVASLLL
jgi:membrane associated rhomboid family serine protease